MANLLNPTLDILSADIYPKYYTPTYAGRLFHATVDTAGVALAAAGTSAGIALANPAGTKRNLAIVEVNIALVSGTFVLGSIMHGVNTNTIAAAVTGTAITPVPGFAGSGFTPVGKFFKTATLPATQTALKPMVNKNATAATSNWFMVQDFIDGQIVLAPGATWSLYLVGADTSPLEISSVTWVETDL